MTREIADEVPSDSAGAREIALCDFRKPTMPAASCSTISRRPTATALR